MADKLRAGVIGAGVFGGYHAAKWAAFEGVSLTAVSDIDPRRAQATAERFGATPFSDAADFFAATDLVSITCPAGGHATWALAALKAGKSVYVEKPLAVDMAAADKIVLEGAKRGLIVACGFLERAALEASGISKVPERLVSLDAVRRSPPSERNRDVSVILDLMIHDLDIALALTPGSPFAVEGESRGSSPGESDDGQAEVVFDDGVTARFAASRTAETAERRLHLIYPSGEVTIDLLAGTLTHTTPFDLDPDFGERPAGRDRLGASLAAFLRAVRGEGTPLADGRDGARALDLALAVEQALSEG